MKSETTLITGASSGIGLHLAMEFARHGHSLVLIAPVQSELERISADLMVDHNVQVDILAKDLRDPAAAEEIHSACRDLDIEILVNNAGIGKKGKAWEIPLEDDLSMLRLNVEAVIRLNKFFLPGFIARQKGKILHTSSVSGFQPGPNHAIYAATKAFLLSYSEALSTELEGTGVTATALCPGPTDTDFFPKANMMETRAFQQAELMAPQEVAKAAYRALMKCERVEVPGMSNKALVFSRRFLPESAQAKVFETMMSDVPPDQQKRDRGDEELKYEASRDRESAA